MVRKLRVVGLAPKIRAFAPVALEVTFRRTSSLIGWSMAAWMRELMFGPRPTRSWAAVGPRKKMEVSATATANGMRIQSMITVPKLLTECLIFDQMVIETKGSTLDWTCFVSI
jgi:hypothetical protein